MRRQALYRVTVAGQDISAVLAPILHSLRVTDHEGTHSDTADVVIDDTGGRVLMPRDGDPMVIALGWSGADVATVFEGTVDEPKSEGTRGAGRTLTITAKGLDTKAKAKQPFQRHVDNKTLHEAMQTFGGLAGISDIRIDPALASIRRPWWGLNDESFLHFGERIAREVGGIFKISGSRAILARMGGGAVSGQEMPTVQAVWGEGGNLLRWSLTPSMGRPRFRRTRARFYDRAAAKWREEEVEVEDPAAVATLTDRYSRADPGEAKSAATRGARSSERERGGGTLEIDGSNLARPGGHVLLVGARPGIDGLWRIETVTHALSRSSGWTTSLSVKTPDVGGDSRSASGGAAASGSSGGLTAPNNSAGDATGPVSA